MEWLLEVVAGGWWQENGGVAGGLGSGMTGLAVFGMAYRYRTEPKLSNTGNACTTKHGIRIGIDQTARLQP